ncbi:hypothetical protein EDC01DRAFT_16609 [Geopyxis carbonaria]|nr:hypothetical protein EDC01DRAFT_16609 [Geopyxis carbonaria]
MGWSSCLPTFFHSLVIIAFSSPYRTQFLFRSRLLVDTSYNTTLLLFIQPAHQHLNAEATSRASCTHGLSLLLITFFSVPVNQQGFCHLTIYSL